MSWLDRVFGRPQLGCGKTGIALRDLVIGQKVNAGVSVEGSVYDAIARNTILKDDMVTVLGLFEGCAEVTGTLAQIKEIQAGTIDTIKQVQDILTGKLDQANIKTSTGTSLLDVDEKERDDTQADSNAVVYTLVKTVTASNISAKNSLNKIVYSEWANAFNEANNKIKITYETDTVAEATLEEHQIVGVTEQFKAETIDLTGLYVKFRVYLQCYNVLSFVHTKLFRVFGKKTEDITYV